MSQNRTVMAFRKRMKHWGWSDIRIECDLFNKELYWVQAIEPLSGTRIRTSLTLTQMHQRFRH